MGGNTSIPGNKILPEEKIVKVKNSFEDILHSQRTDIYDAFNKYFGKIVFTKITNKMLNGVNFSMYYAKINCMLCLEERYLIAVTPWDRNSIGSQFYLTALPWVSFQARTYKETPEDIKNCNNIKGLKGQAYESNSDVSVMNDIIEVEKRGTDKTYYISHKYPLKIDLLNKRKSTKIGNSGEYSENEYPDRTVLKNALENYQTVITMLA